MSKIIEAIKDQDFRFINMLKNVLMAYILSIILLIVFAIILTYTSFPEGSIPTVVLVVSIIGILFGAKLSASKAKSRGWLVGSVTGLLYMLILFLISLLFNQRPAWDMHVLFIFAVGFIAGAVGGVIGINFKKPEKRYR